MVTSHPRQRLDVVGVDEPAVLPAQQVLQQDLQGIRQPGQPGETGFFERGQAEVLEAAAGRRSATARVLKEFFEFCEAIL